MSLDVVHRIRGVELQESGEMKGVIQNGHKVLLRACVAGPENKCCCNKLAQKAGSDTARLQTAIPKYLKGFHT